MSFDDGVSDVNKFKQWAVLMGCPLESLPLDDTLRRTFATQHGRRLINITQLIAPAAKLAAVRQNIHVHQLRVYYENAAGGNLRQKNPPAIQRMQRVREVRSQLSSLRVQIAEKRTLLDGLRARVAENSRAATRAATESRLARANERLLASKLRSLDASLQHERTVTATIAKLTPVQFNAALHSDAQARIAILETIHTIHAHYDDQPTSSLAAASAEPTLLSASSELWSRLTQHVANMPNCLLWTCVSAAQTRNVDAIKQLSATAQRSKHLGGHQQSARSQLQFFLTRARTKHIAIQLSLAAATRQLEAAFDESVMQPYQAFMQRVHQMARNNAAASDYDAPVVDNYIVEYTAHQYNRGQLDFVLGELTARQREYATKSARLGNHTAAIGALQAAYADTESCVNETRDASAALYAIKQKLQFLEGNLRALMLEARDVQQQGGALVPRRQQNATFNTTLLGAPNGGSGGAVDTSLGGSFDLSRSSDLCSTRMDETLQASLVDGTARGGGGGSGGVNCVQHVAELTAYVEATMGGLASQTATMYTLQQLGHESIPHHTLLNSHLYRLSDVAYQIEHTCKWHAQIEQLLDYSPVVLPLQNLDMIPKMRQKHIAEQNLFNELHDRCLSLAGLVQQRQHLTDQLCAFLVDNTLQEYIPPKKLFNDRSYKDYEEEFMAHFKIVANAKEAQLEDGDGVRN